MCKGNALHTTIAKSCVVRTSFLNSHCSYMALLHATSHTQVSLLTSVVSCVCSALTADRARQQTLLHSPSPPFTNPVNRPFMTQAAVAHSHIQTVTVCTKGAQTSDHTHEMPNAVKQRNPSCAPLTQRSRKNTNIFGKGCHYKNRNKKQ